MQKLLNAYILLRHRNFLVFMSRSFQGYTFFFISQNLKIPSYIIYTIDSFPILFNLHHNQYVWTSFCLFAWTRKRKLFSQHSCLLILLPLKKNSISNLSFNDFYDFVCHFSSTFKNSTETSWRVTLLFFLHHNRTPCYCPEYPSCLVCLSCVWLNKS